jgi:hypothetical protein
MKALLTAAGIFLLAGCGPQGSAPQTEVGNRSSQETATERRVDSRPALGTRIRTDRQYDETQKARFLKAIRDADPQERTIQRALMNEEGELGLILNRNVATDDIPRLMKSMLKRMASEFPGQDLTIVAYAPSDPPLKIGTARLDAASREMTYTPARH